ncbi:DUF3703 domain-containing protein [Flagellatimonas centrodinii]|uniref:DUF3703 domain-containing protein n=1 Tax=Flagellatimonas centrodinii TaxID=2806210 RepID=UPI001FED898E|nr:DUF3703 domain-containing protein [Flagellatimonas centrodinii]ULQ46235.1 DUF3703 domain-containing protein [Flagellatimonas centrodinii]
MSTFANNIRPPVTAELVLAETAEHQGNISVAFRHLERAHILGQASTREHVRVHCHMLLWGLRRRSFKEILGQITRVIGAATKTAIGLVPAGNTGGANVSPFKSFPVPAELQRVIAAARSGK